MTWQNLLCQWLAYAAVSSCLLFAVALIAMMITDQPARRLRFIQWAFVGALLAPLLNEAGATPQWYVGLFAGETAETPGDESTADLQPRVKPVKSDSAPATRVAAIPKTDAGDVRRLPIEEPLRDPGLEKKPVAESAARVPPSAVAEVPLAEVETPTAAAASKPGIDLPGLVLLAYAGIAGGLLLWSCVGMLRLFRLKRRSEPAPEEVAAALIRISGASALAARTQVRISDSVPGPLTYGWYRPVIVLPRAVCAPGRGHELAYCLAHEWDHVNRRDILPWQFATLLQAVFFYQPMFWWLRRQMRLCQDYLADAFAAQHAEVPEDYAEFLVEQARRCTTRYSAALGIVHSKSTLYRRVEMVLDDERTLESRCRKGWNIVVGVAALALVTAVATVRLDAGKPAAEPVADAPADTKAKPAEAPKATKKDDAPVKPEAKAVTYNGVVVDRVSGKPIPDTNVIVELTNSKPPKGKEDWKKVIRAKSDANGKYSFTIGPEEAAQHYLYVVVDAHHPDYVAKGRSGYGHLMIRKNLKLGEPPFFSKIKLWPGKPVTGTVVAPDGKPQKGVKILTYSKHTKAGRWSFGGFYTTYTDEKGKFRFVAATPGEGVYWVTPAGFSPQAHVIPEDRGDVGKVVLQHGSVIKGKVLNAKGKPVSNVRVSARRNGDGEDVDRFLNQNAVAGAIGRMATTNAKGEFALDELPAGDYELRIRPLRLGWAAESLPDVFVRSRVTIQDGIQPPPVEIRAVPHVEIHVRFVDSKGKPTGSHRFHVFGRMDNKSYFSQSTQVNKKTGIGIVRVPHGLQRVTVNLMTNEHGALRWRIKPGQPLQNSRRVELGTLEADHHDLEVVRFVAPILLVKAVDENGKLLAEFKPKAIYQKGGSPNAPGTRFISGVRGDVNFEKQPDGRWRSSQLFPDLKLAVTAELDGYTTKPRTVSLKEGTTRELVFVMKPKSEKSEQAKPAKKTSAIAPQLPGKIVGRITDRATGKGIANAVVDVEVRTGTRAKRSTRKLTVRTSRQGEYTVPFTPQETRQSDLYLFIRATHENYVAKRDGFSQRRIQEFVETAKGKPFHDLRLWPGKAVSGVVETPGGRPLAGVKMMAFARPAKSTRYDFSGFHEFKTDSKGRFRYVLPASGTAALWVYPDGYAVQGRLIELPRGDLGKIVVQKGTRMKGVVRDAKGKPLANIYVGARKMGNDTPAETFLNENGIAHFTVRDTRTNTQGEFELDELPDGDYRVQVEPNRDPTAKSSPNVFLRQSVKLSAQESPALLVLRAVPQVQLQVEWVDAKGKPARGDSFYVHGRLDGTSWHRRAGMPDPKTGRVSINVPHGLQDAVLDIIAARSTGWRWRVKPGDALRRGRRVPLGNIDDDRSGLQIVRYNAPVLTIKPVDENGTVLQGVTIESLYPLQKPPAKFGSRAITGDVWFREQQDGRWVSAQMLPDEETTITLKKPGYKTTSQKITLKEGARRELAITLKKQPGPATSNRTFPRIVRSHSVMRRLAPLFLLAYFATATSAATAEPIRLPGGATLKSIDFERHVVGLMGQLGCNAGACHGSFQGKGGFRLSLFGYSSDFDYKSLTRDHFGRRISTARPSESLLLRKPTMQTAHEGGRRMKTGSWQYRVIHRWIADGAKRTPGSGAVAELRLLPENLTLSDRSPKQLRVVARFTDGAEEDVTPFCTFRIQNDAVAVASAEGVVTAGVPGDTGVIAEYRGHFATTRAIVPVPESSRLPWPDIHPAGAIDDDVFAKLRRLGITPSPNCSDTDFLRRLALDTIGRIPTPDEVRRFVNDKRPDKRARAIEAFLADPMHAALWATRLSDITGNEIDALPGSRDLQPKYAAMWHNWLRARIANNTPYDEIVKGILTTTSRGNMPIAGWITKRAKLLRTARGSFRNGYSRQPALDLYWKRPAGRLAEISAAAFMGVRIECAQCHKHPFDRWTQTDYRAFVNIFARMRYGSSPELRAAMVDRLDERRRLRAAGKALPPPLPRLQEAFLSRNANWEKDPETGAPLKPKALGGPEFSPTGDARRDLFAWLTRPGNPYFAKTFVNRVWAHYFGRGLVHPVDDFSVVNPPSHARLLDRLSRDFVRSGYDIRRLERLILNSQTYQLSSTPNQTNRWDRTNFSRAYVRGLPAEVAVDTLQTATGVRLNFGNDVPRGARAIEIAPSRLRSATAGRLFQVFERPARKTVCDCERRGDPSVRQALFLMTDTQLLTDASSGRLKQLLAGDLTDDAIVDELFLATFSRFPKPDERAAVRQHLKSKSDRNKAFADLFWALSEAAAAPTRSTTGAAQSVILVWLSGGPATIDMWDLKPDAPEEIRGEFQPIATSAPGIEISEHLPRMAKVIDRCVLVRSVHHGLPAHGPGANYVTSGNLPSAAIEYPSLGSLSSALLEPREGVPPYVAIGRPRGAGSGYLGAAHNPFVVQSSGFRGRLRASNVSLPKGFTLTDLKERNELRRVLDRRFAKWQQSDNLLSGLGKFQQQALDILRTDRIGKALDVDKEPEAVRSVYGTTPVGRHALAARRLVEAGARFVTIGTSGWDTHTGNFASLRNRLLPPLDRALAALIADLDKRRLLKSTVVLCAGEFNRTPNVNRTAGRDHWSRSMSMLLAGGNLRRGFVFGATDKHGKEPVANPCSPDDVAATLMATLGFEAKHRAQSQNGRPIELFRKGRVLRELF
eukprot:g5303.t1